MFNRFGTALDSRLQYGAAEVTGAPAILESRLQDVTAELAYGLLGCYVEEAGCLRVEVADDPVLIDGIDTFDYASEHCLGLCFSAAQRARQVDEVASHVFHRSGQHAHFC